MVDRTFTNILPQAGPSNKIQISISCRNLADMDLLSKSDPEVHVYLRDSKS